MLLPCYGLGSFCWQAKHTISIGLRWTKRQGLCEELKKIGYLGRPLELNISAYREAHIEQGPVLENKRFKLA